MRPVTAGCQVPPLLLQNRTLYAANAAVDVLTSQGFGVLAGQFCTLVCVWSGAAFL